MRLAVGLEPWFLLPGSVSRPWPMAIWPAAGPIHAKRRLEKPCGTIFSFVKTAAGEKVSL